MTHKGRQSLRWFVGVTGTVISGVMIWLLCLAIQLLGQNVRATITLQIQMQQVQQTLGGFAQMPERVGRIEDKQINDEQQTAEISRRLQRLEDHR